LLPIFWHDTARENFSTPPAACANGSGVVHADGFMTAPACMKISVGSLDFPERAKELKRAETRGSCSTNSAKT
jgi:hypothetical protein